MQMHLHPNPSSAHSHAASEQHMKSSAMLRDIVIGMSDGLTVPFALAAGLSGAGVGSEVVVTAGLAEIVAGSIAMGLGGFLAGKTEKDHYDAEYKREVYEVEHLPDREREEIRQIFEQMGFSPETQQRCVEELSADKDRWLEFMMKYELGLEEPHPQQATRSAVAIGLSYVAGGIVPLLPYVFVSKVHQALLASCAVTLLCLLVFGYFKSRVTGQPPFRGALYVAGIGAMAAAAAFLLARLLG